MSRRSAVVSIIGRPNVGKSTIFNRLMKKNFKAMAYNQPGVTRDRHYGIATVESERADEEADIILVDTGGFYPEKVETSDILGKKKTAEPFFNLMADQAKLAIDESDLVLFVTDVREGLLPFDKTIADYVRTTKKPMWLLVNKFDDDSQWGSEAEFYELGLSEEEFLLVSAEHNRGLVELSEKLFNFSKEGFITDDISIQRGVKPNQDVVANIAIVGAPNAGKSTLLNHLVGAQRALVSNVAGTTVDPIEGYIDLYFGENGHKLQTIDHAFRKSSAQVLEEYKDFEETMSDTNLISYGQMPDDLRSIKDSNEEDDEVFADENIDDESQENEEYINPYRSIKLVDTAGIRRQSNVKGFIEEQSVYRSLRAISESDIVLYMIDATIGMTHQDRRLCDIAIEKGKSLMICLNKVDLLRETMMDNHKKRNWLEDLKATIPWLSFCEIHTISAKKGSYLSGLKKGIVKTIYLRNKKISTSRLNKLLSVLVDRNPVVLERSNGTRFKVKYASMLKSAPPTFLLFCNKSKGVPTNFKKYLVNSIRSEFKYKNTPVHLIYRSSSDMEKKLIKATRHQEKL